MPEQTTTYRTMTEIASSAIRDSIVSGLYPPGKRLIPPLLERELNLSRVSIREALKELAGTGLVTIVPNKGAAVSEAISEEELKEVFEIRFILEGKASELASAQIPDEAINELEKVNHALRDSIQNPKEYFILNRRWHLDFYRASGWQFLCQIIELLFDRVLVFRNIHPFRVDAIPGYIEDHALMMKAMRLRDSAQVKEIMLRHLRAGGYESIMSLKVGQKTD